MQAPPLAALAGGAWASQSHRPAILAAPASLRRSRRGALRLPAWRAAGGGRAPRVPAKGAVLASDMGAEELVGPSPLLDARSEQGSTMFPNAPGLTLHFCSLNLVKESTQKSHLIRSFIQSHVVCRARSTYQEGGGEREVACRCCSQL